MISYAPALILITIFLVTIVVVALSRPSDRVRQIAIVLTTCVYLLHILIAFAMYVATIVIPPTQWTVRTDSLVLTLTVAIATAFPFVELAGVVMSLDWRGGTPPTGELADEGRETERGRTGGPRAHPGTNA